MGIDMDKSIFWQQEFALTKKSRGFHLITEELAPLLSAMPLLKVGLANFFLQHTSASLAINENASMQVRLDLERYFSESIPEDEFLYRHKEEGADDMPAHIKNIVLGSSITIPIKEGNLALGQWQGIYLCEHRNNALPRHIIITAQGIQAT
jgi:secondary thiamine-phosphate synthase enzyme